VQVQEAERASVALELHDNITQLLVAVLFRSQTLVDQLSTLDGPAKAEAIQLRGLLGRTGEEVERISRNLRPSVLEHLGLDAVLRTAGAEFTARTGVPVKLAGGKLSGRLPAAIGLALYRIFQEALKNVEQHAHARHVTVKLARSGDQVQLTIKDDGIGFSADGQQAGRKGRGGLGLLGMRERATYVGGEFTIRSVFRAGTEITVRVPLGDGVVEV